MKKIISIALLLAMALSLFAGCGSEPTKPAGNPLDSAVAYLKNMYDKSTKNEDNKLTADKELLPVVTIDGVAYSISWTIKVTAGPADCVAIAAGASAGSQKIDLVYQPEEEVRFVLTGTVSDANGGTKTIDIKFYSPAVQKVEVTEGQKVVIYLVGDAKYMTGIDYLYTSSSGSQKHELALTTDKAEALPLTLKTNDDGTVTFVTDGGLFLACDATNVQFVAEANDNTKFVLEAAEGGQLIKCAVANYNGKPQYLEVYNNYMTCYGISETSNLALYIFELQDATGAQGTIGESTPAEPTEPADPVDPVVAQLPTITAPVVGTAYKFGSIQVNTGNTVYITGAIDQDRFLITTADKAAALDVYVEAVEGGIKISTTIDGAKVYIALYTNDAGKTALGYNAEGTVFAFNAELCCWFANLDGTDYYMGTYNTFETISASKTSYITAENSGVSQFPAGFFSAEGADPVTPTEPTEPADPTEPSESGVYTLDATSDLTAMDAGAKADGDVEVVNDYFTIIYKSKTKIDGSEKTFEDGYTATQRLNIGGKTEPEKNMIGSVMFTTAKAGTIKVWWVSGGDGREIALYNANGEVIAATSTDSVKNSLYISELEIPEASTYYLGVPTGSNYIFKIEVSEKEATESGETSEAVAELTAQLELAKQLANGAYLDVVSAITGTIIDDPVASSRTEGQYKFTVSDGTNSVYCYYVPVTGGTPTKGATITVTGKLSAYNGAPQFEEKESVGTLVTEPAEPTEPVDPADPTEPAETTALATGDKVVIYAPSYNMALSATKTGYYNVGVSVAAGFDGLSAAEIWVVTVNADGSYTFVSETGSKLALAESYSSLNDTGVNDKWSIVAKDGAEGIIYLKNIGRDCYLEWYASKDNWSTYNPGSLSAEYELVIYKIG